MRRALIIGINDYSGSPLTGCLNDAHSMKGCLETHSDGSPNFAVELITAPPSNATRSEIKKAITALFASPVDIAFLYFSGHGYLASTGGYIVTTDAKKYDEGVSMDEILTLANDSPAKDKIIIFDCCHSGSMGTSPTLRSAAGQIAEGVAILTACRPAEVALESQGANAAGVFTELVVDALQGGAADLRGHITPGSIYAYVDQALGAWDQRPIFKTNVSRFTSLRTVSPPVPLGTLRKICDYFKAPQDLIQLDPSYEFSCPTQNPANVSVMKDLQKYVGVGLVKPVDEEHMYFAAMNSKSCRLTAFGAHYWRLVKEKKL